MSRLPEVPWFRSSEEEAELWETHSPLDYQEYFEDCEVLLGDAPTISAPFYGPDLGNLPLPFIPSNLPAQGWLVGKLSAPGTRCA